MSVISNSASC